MYKLKRTMSRIITRFAKTMTVALTWVTFLLFLPCLVYASYYLFWDFDARRVFSAVILMAVSILLNKFL